jgi:hypothetical protein
MIEYGECGRIRIGRGNRSNYSEKNSPTVTLYTINPRLTFFETNKYDFCIVLSQLENLLDDINQFNRTSLQNSITLSNDIERASEFFCVWIPSRGTRYSPLHSIQTEFGAHPSSYSGVPGTFSREGGGVKQQALEADHSSPSSVELKKCGAIYVLHHTSSWHIS